MLPVFEMTEERLVLAVCLGRSLENGMHWGGTRGNFDGGLAKLSVAWHEWCPVGDGFGLYQVEGFSSWLIGVPFRNRELRSFIKTAFRCFSLVFRAWLEKRWQVYQLDWSSLTSTIFSLSLDTETSTKDISYSLLRVSVLLVIAVSAIEARFSVENEESGSTSVLKIKLRYSFRSEGLYTPTDVRFLWLAVSIKVRCLSKCGIHRIAMGTGLQCPWNKDVCRVAVSKLMLSMNCDTFGYIISIGNRKRRCVEARVLSKVGGFLVLRKTATVMMLQIWLQKR